MSSLNGKRPMDTYRELLKISATSLTGTLTTVETGDGIATPLKVSTTGVSIGGVTFPTTGAADGKVLQVGVDGVTASWVTPAAGGATDYNDLTNKPTLFSGAFADLTGTPTFSDVATSGSYDDLLDLPSLFSGSYADLTNKPSLFSGAYGDLTGAPTFADVAFSGDYADLINAPTGSESVAWADVTGKPAVIAAGADAAEARGVIGAAADVEFEWINVVQSGVQSTMAANVTLGAAIPNTVTGAVWTVGQYRAVTGGGSGGTAAGAIYVVGASGVVTLYAQANQSLTGNTVQFDRYVRHTWTGDVRLYRRRASTNTIYGVASALPQLYHTFGSVTTDASNQLTNALKPFESAKLYSADYSDSGFSPAATMTIGNPIPGTVGKTYQDGTVALSMNFAGTLGNLYTLNSSGAWSLTADFSSNGYRVVSVDATAADSGLNTFRGTLVLRREGSTRELALFIPPTEMKKTGAAVNSYAAIGDVIGNPATLNTTSKVVVGALNELKVLADAASPFKSEYLHTGTGGSFTVTPALKGNMLAVLGTIGQETTYTTQVAANYPEGFFFDIYVGGHTGNTIVFNPNGSDTVGTTYPNVGVTSKTFNYGEVARIFKMAGPDHWFYVYLEQKDSVVPLSGIAVTTVLNNATTYSATAGSPITSGTRPVVWADGMSVLSLHDGALYNFNAAGSNFGLGVAMDTDTNRIYNSSLDSPNGWASGSILVQKNELAEITHNAQTGAYAVKASNVWMNNQNVADLIGDFDNIDWQSGSSLTEAIDEVYDMASVVRAPVRKTKTIGSPYSVLTSDHGYNMKIYTSGVTAVTASTAAGLSSYPDGFWFSITHQGLSHTSTWTFDPFSTESVTNMDTGATGTTLVVYPGETYTLIKANSSEWYAFGNSTTAQLKADTTVMSLPNNSATQEIYGPQMGSYFTLTTGSSNITGWTLPVLRSSTAWTCAILITQGATARTVAWPSAFKWEGGTVPTVTAVAGAKDLLTLTTFDGGTTYQASLSKGRA